MQDGREASVWGALAAAFGDGLVFGVSMHLTRDAVRVAANRTRPEMQSMESRVAAIEHRPERASRNGSAPALASGIANSTPQFERHISELEVKFQVQIDSLYERDRAVSLQLDQQLNAFRDHVMVLHRDFAQTLSRLVDEQIEAAVSARVGRVEEQLRQTVRDEIQLLTSALERRLAERDAKVFELIHTLGQTCVETAGRMSPLSPDMPE